MWEPYENGKIISTTGSENGIILFDEVLSCGARITLEQDGYTPYAITCGIYGLMVHTAFAGTEQEALEKYNSMKQNIQLFLAKETNDKENSEWCDWFANEY